MFLKPSLSEVSIIYTLPFRRSVWVTYVALVAILTVAMFVTHRVQHQLDPSQPSLPFGDAVLASLALICQEGKPCDSLYTHIEQPNIKVHRRTGSTGLEFILDQQRHTFELRLEQGLCWTWDDQEPSAAYNTAEGRINSCVPLECVCVCLCVCVCVCVCMYVCVFFFLIYIHFIYTACSITSE